MALYGAEEIAWKILLQQVDDILDMIHEPRYISENSIPIIVELKESTEIQLGEYYDEYL